MDIYLNNVLLMKSPHTHFEILLSEESIYSKMCENFIYYVKRIFKSISFSPTAIFLNENDIIFLFQ